MEPRACQDRPKSPRQSLRQVFSIDQVDQRSLEQVSSTELVARYGSKRVPKSDFGHLGSLLGFRHDKSVYELRDAKVPSQLQLAVLR